MTEPFCKNSSALNVVNIYCKKLHHRYSKFPSISTDYAHLPESRRLVLKEMFTKRLAKYYQLVKISKQYCRRKYLQSKMAAIKNIR